MPVSSEPSASPLEGTPDVLRAALESALGAQYTVVRLLGRGGMGAVYLARERLLERFVAIKVLITEQADEGARERFLREARTAAVLSHPNIVPLLSFGDLGETLFYIMRYVDGESLEARLRRDGRLPPDETRRILSELAEALRYAHSQGVVHRDIKPDNVLIEHGTGLVMLTDFGVARRPATTTTLTGTGMVVGTPQYMSPEQASGERTIDGRSDLYGLGLIGYRMLTGALPFTGDSVQDILVQQITRTPRPLVERAPETPLDLAAAVMKCLEKAPADRWADAASFRFAIATAGMDAPAVPDALEGLPRLGTRVAAVAYLFVPVLAFIHSFDSDPVWLLLALAAPVVGLPLALTPLVVRARRHGVPWRRALAIAFWPIAGWSGWWPKRLRPPDDVWDRLPSVVRRARLAGSVLLGIGILGTIPSATAMFLSVGHKSWVDAFFTVQMASGVATVVAAIVFAFMMRRVGRELGVTGPELGKLGGEPTFGSRFWERPSIARLLSARRIETDAPDTPEAIASAVRDIAAALPSGVSTIAAAAIRAADDLSSALSNLERRYAQLSDPADLGEQQRIEARLAALGAEHTSDPPAKRQMRGLLASQLTLLRELDSRRTALRGGRQVLHEQLKTLWLQLVALRAQSSSHSADLSDLHQRIEDLCRGIENRVSAVRETQELGRLTAADESGSGSPRG